MLENYYSWANFILYIYKQNIHVYDKNKNIFENCILAMNAKLSQFKLVSFDHWCDINNAIDFYKSFIRNKFGIFFPYIQVVNEKFFNEKFECELLITNKEVHNITMANIHFLNYQDFIVVKQPVNKI